MSDKDITEEILSAFISEMLKGAKEIYKEASDEYNAFVGTGVKKYLLEKILKYRYLRTILKGNTPVYFYSVYYHLDIVKKDNFLTQRKKTVLKTNNCDEIFIDSNFVTIIGDGGSGKSTLVKHLFMQSINNQKKIPIMIELRYLKNNKLSLLEHIEKTITESEITSNQRILKKMLAAGRFIFFFDGFDEVDSANESNLMKDIDLFTSKYNQNYYILTTRPNSNGENVSNFTNHHIAKLSREKGDIDKFIDLQLSEEPELAKKIKTSVKSGVAEHIQSFLTNPLLLSLYILTYQSNAEIPDKKYIFYRRVINSLYAEHDSKSKLGYVRSSRSKLNQIDFENIMQSFCFVAFFESKFSFDHDYVVTKIELIKKAMDKFDFTTTDLIYDLKVSISLWVDDGGILSFAHRSLQEYFAALYIKNLSEESKKVAYSKTENYCTLKKNLGEIRNFLSLCEEMDTVCFYQHLYLPMCRELLSHLDAPTEKEATRRLILYFCKTMRIRKQGDKFFPIPNVEDQVYKAISIHLKFTQEFHDNISEKMKELIHEKIVEKKENKSLSIIDNEIYHALANKIDDSEARLIAFSLISHIKNEIKQKEKYIKNSIRVDNTILNMI